MARPIVSNSLVVRFKLLDFHLNGEHLPSTPAPDVTKRLTLSMSAPSACRLGEERQRWADLHRELSQLCRSLSQLPMRAQRHPLGKAKDEDKPPS